MFLGSNLSAILPLSTFTKYHLLASQYPSCVTDTDNISINQKTGKVKKLIICSSTKISHYRPQTRSTKISGVEVPESSTNKQHTLS